MRKPIRMRADTFPDRSGALPARVWFVIPNGKKLAFRALYATHGVRGTHDTTDEVIGQMVKGKAGNWMTASNRIGTSEGERFHRETPTWVQVFHAFPPPEVWEPADDPISGARP